MYKLEKAKKALKDVYEKYKDEGVLSVYIWGSILTDDFNPETSDIDTIAIVEDRLPIDRENEMKEYVRSAYPELDEIFIRFLYLSELDGGSAKAPLAKVILPPILLLEMPSWLYVDGEDFKNTDFSIQPPTFQEAIRIRLNRKQKEGWYDVANIPKDLHLYFLKGLVRIIDLLHKKQEMSLRRK